MTIVTHGDETVIEQITKQLNKLVEVVKVVDLNESRFVERELMLVKLRAAGKDRDEFLRLTEIYRGSVVDVTDRSYTIEITGSTEKLDSFLETVGPCPNFGNRTHRRGRYRSWRAYFENLTLYRSDGLFTFQQRPSEKQ